MPWTPMMPPSLPLLPPGGGKGRKGGRRSSRGADSFLLVVDVSAIYIDKFQQSKSYMFLMAPQLQFIDRVVDIPVFRAETCTHSANCAAHRGVPTGAVLGQYLRLALVVSAAIRFPTFHDAHHLRVVSAIVCGLGMSIDFVDPVSSGKYSGTFVFSAPVAEPIVMSFTAPLSYCTIVATATVVTSCSSSSDCGGCLRHDVVWWSRWCLQFYLGQREADYWKIHRLLFPVPRGRWGVCLLNVWFSSNDEVCADNYTLSRFKLTASVAVRSGICICTAI